MQIKRILFVYSGRDPAGKLIANEIISYYGLEKISSALYARDTIYLVETEGDIVYTDGIDSRLKINPEVLIFLSRHSSAMKRKTLSVHASGNPTHKAELGGKPCSLAPSHPIIMKSVLYNLNYLVSKYNLQEYAVTMEVTHHGPTEIKSPSLFVEIGSTIEEWKDPRAVKVITEAIIRSLEKPFDGVPAVGFGGPHYAPEFTRYALSREYAVGHIFSKYVIGNISYKVVKEAFKKSFNSNIALIDWKGIKSEYRRQIINMISRLGKEIIKT